LSFLNPKKQKRKKSKSRFSNRIFEIELSKKGAPKGAFFVFIPRNNSEQPCIFKVAKFRGGCYLLHGLAMGWAISVTFHNFS
jgi:hypothetical protein